LVQGARTPHGQNRVHVDLVADDREKEIARLVALGATRGPDHDEHGHSLTVMTDPESNDFCIAQHPPGRGSTCRVRRRVWH
jgi:hypothetical protein